MAEFAKRMVKWMGSSRCDFCRADLGLTPWFVDGRVGSRTMWAVMCSICWKRHGCGRYGTGYGQKYNGKTFEKMGG